MKRRGRLGSLTSAVGDVAGALRRRREAREPRVRLYDERGQVRTLEPAEPDALALVEAARAMIDAVDSRRREGER